MNELLVLEIQRKLEKLKYPTPLAIAKEIVAFTEGSSKEIEKILERIKKDEPWEYIRGWTYFCKNKIFLNKDVLIPRIETEELVNITCKDIGDIKGILQIFDIGTGSGCIAITLSKNFNHPVYAIDISQKALKVAEKNLMFHKCQNIKLINADLLDFNFDSNIPTAIVANLPYIPSGKIESLQNSVRKYEPYAALDGGFDGTRYYAELLKQLKKKKVNLKYILFEIDKDNEEGLKKYKGKFLKDSFGETRFFSIPPSRLKLLLK